MPQIPYQYTYSYMLCCHLAFEKDSAYIKSPFNIFVFYLHHNISF